MPKPTGPPVIIPEDGLTLPAGTWQVIFILLAPLLAATAIFLPLVLVLSIACPLIVSVYEHFYPTKTFQPTRILTDNENT